MIDVISLPSHLPPERLAKAQVVVLDVLRASSTIVTALAHGARAVHVYGEIEQAKADLAKLPYPALTGGERQGLKIEGFDLGNSPEEYVSNRISGATIALTTTNGTRAMIAAAPAAKVFIGSLLNASATAEALLPDIQNLDTILLCAGTDGKLSCEDMFGAGAICWQLLQQTHSIALPFTDSAWLAYQAYVGVRTHLPAALRLGQGGINLIDAGLEEDIDMCARLDAKPIIAQLERATMTVRRAEDAVAVEIA